MCCYSLQLSLAHWAHPPPRLPRFCLLNRRCSHRSHLRSSGRPSLPATIWWLRQRQRLGHLRRAFPICWLITDSLLLLARTSCLPSTPCWHLGLFSSPCDCRDRLRLHSVRAPALKRCPDVCSHH